MRLLKIEIEGITSLKEKTVIDFEHDLEGEDLFGITGPTGSGKSTILNSIAMALFYKSHKELNPEDFVSLGAKRGKISLDFEMNGDKYTSKWECALYGVRGGRLKDPKPVKEFYKNGESLDLKKITPETVIGLDEDQFQKTVIINQGKFSDFITSSFKDRKILLEKIYTSENITGFPSYLNKEISKLNDQKALHESTLKGGLPITEGQYNENLTREKNISIELETLEKQYSYLEVLNQNLKELVENTIKINKSKEDLEKASTQLEVATKELIDKETRSKNADDIYTKFESQLRKELPEIDRGEQLNKDIDQLKEQLKTKQSKIKENQKHLDEENKKLVQIKKDIDELKEEQEKAKKTLTKILNPEEIHNAENCIQSLTVFLSQLKNNRQRKTETDKKLDESKAKGLKLKEYETLFVEKLNIQDSDIESVIKNKTDYLEKLEKELNHLSLSIEKTKELINEYTKNSKDIELLQVKQDKTLKEKNEYLQKLDLCSKEIELCNKEIKLNENLIAIKRCVDEAHKQGKCPVCDNVDLSNLNNIDNNLDSEEALQQKASKLSEEKFYLQSKINELDIDSKRSDEDLIECSSENQAIKRKLEDITVSNKLSIKNITELDSPLLNKKIEKQSEIKNLKAEIDGLRQSTSELLIHKQKIESERDNYTVLKKEVDELEIKLQANQKSLDEEHQKLASIAGVKFESIEETKGLINQSRSLQKLNESILNNEKLSNNYIEQNERIQSQLKEFEVEIRETENSILAKSKELEIIHNNFDTKDLKALKDSKQNKLKELQIEKDNLMKELHSAQMKKGELNTKIEWKQENINDLGNHVLRYLNKLQNRPTIVNPTKEIDEIDQKVHKISLHESAHFEEWEIENISGFHDDVVRYHHQSIKEKTAEIKEEAVEIRTINKAYKSKVDEFNKISQEIIKIDKKLESKLKVKDVIGRDEFTRYAISMIEEQLIMMANTELEKLCDGRYILFQQEKNKTKGPEFFIKDLWRSSSERPLQSLSGGETFMVSLAMALGLAEMSRGQTEIDTFFIDEGFGTLDQDSLEEVLNILMSIRSRGKQIGIISHVKELTDRLPIKIQLQKNQLGESQVEISTI